jgi:hypothetical protein
LHEKEQRNKDDDVFFFSPTRNFELEVPPATPLLQRLPAPAAAMAHAAADLRRRIKEKRAAIGRRITESRDRAAAASSAFNAALLEARSVANQTVANRGISTSSPPLLLLACFCFCFGFALQSMV